MRLRTLAAILIQPHLAKNKRITPEKLLPLPWDKQKPKAKETTLTAKQKRKRMETIAKRLGDKV